MNTKKNYTSADPRQVAPDAPTQRRSLLSARALWSLAAVLVVVLIAGLAFLLNRTADHQLKTLTLSEPQAGSQAVLQVGDMLQVNLEGNPSTGYMWIVEGLDATVLKLVGEPEFHPASSALGASGTVTYRFEAVGAGQTTLKMVYSRPFEKGVPRRRHLRPACSSRASSEGESSSAVDCALQRFGRIDVLVNNAERSM